MQEPHLENNKFTGEVNHTQLTDEIEYINLQNNEFSGSLFINMLPLTTYMIDARKKSFNFGENILEAKHLRLATREFI